MKYAFPTAATPSRALRPRISRKRCSPSKTRCRWFAGKPALLRVFVTNGGMADAKRPPVRATFYQHNLPVYTAEIPGGDYSLPDRPEEGDLAASSNAHIPAYVVRPGMEMVIEIDPGSIPDTATDAGRRLPPTGRLALEVTEVPPLDLTLVPFLWTWNPDRTLADYAAGLSSNDELFRLTRGNAAGR